MLKRTYYKFLITNFILLSQCVVILHQFSWQFLIRVSDSLSCWFLLIHVEKDRLQISERLSPFHLTLALGSTLSPFFLVFSWALCISLVPISSWFFSRIISTLQKISKKISQILGFMMAMWWGEEEDGDVVFDHNINLSRRQFTAEFWRANSVSGFFCLFIYGIHFLVLTATLGCKFWEDLKLFLCITEHSDNWQVHEPLPLTWTIISH